MFKFDNKNTARSALILALAMVGSSACSQIKKLDEMGTNTQHLASQTDHLVNSTDVVGSGVQATEHHARSTYMNLRQGNSLETRRNSLHSMEITPVMDSKILEAGKYMMGFEFQLWTDEEFDDHRRLVKLYTDSAIELQRDLRRYIDQFDLIVNPSSTKDRMKNLFALSAAVHRINPNEEMMDEDLGLPKTSMLTLIEDTLTAKKQIEAGEIQEEDYQHELLNAEQDLVYLLQIRANFLPAMALAKVSEIEDHGFLGIEGLITKIHLRYFSWTAETPSKNTDQIREYTKWINEASRLRDFLTKLGYHPRLTKDLVKIYGHMKIPAEPAIPANASPIDRALALKKQAAIVDFAAAVKNFKNSAYE